MAPLTIRARIGSTGQNDFTISTPISGGAVTSVFSIDFQTGTLVQTGIDDTLAAKFTPGTRIRVAAMANRKTGRVVTGTYSNGDGAKLK